VGFECGTRAQHESGDYRVVACPAARPRTGPIPRARRDTHSACNRLRCSDYHHQPCLCAQLSRIADMINMINSRMASHTQWVDSLTITFIPTTEDSDVIGSVTAAMTARRSAAMVILVSVRAR
jgi:hypothetical protein